MSVDFSLYLRDRPDLETADYLERDGDDWILGGMRLWLRAYQPCDDDALVEQPWRDEIRWELRANGRLYDGTYDDFVELMETLGTRYRGALYSNPTGEVCWYWWDRDALAASVRRWLADGAIDELVDWLARDLRGDSVHDGPRQQIATLVLAGLAKLADDARRPLVRVLWGIRDSLAADARTAVDDAVLATVDAELAAAQATITRERTTAANNATPLPTTREALAELYDRALTDDSARAVLQRGLGYFDGDAFMKAEFGSVLLERARAGAARPSWMWTMQAWPQTDAAPERATPEARAAFAAKGSLAAAIVAKWKETEAYLRTIDDMIERRRRAGERFAGIPDDIRQLAASGRRTDAVAEYARRYGLSLAQARAVVDANV